MAKHSKAHLEACSSAWWADARQIQTQYGYDRIEDAFPSLPTVREYADRTIPGTNPRITLDVEWRTDDIESSLNDHAFYVGPGRCAGDY